MAVHSPNEWKVLIVYMWVQSSVSLFLAYSNIRKDEHVGSLSHFYTVQQWKPLQKIKRRTVCNRKALNNLFINCLYSSVFLLKPILSLQLSHSETDWPEGRMILPNHPESFVVKQDLTGPSQTLYYYTTLGFMCHRVDNLDDITYTSY